MGSLSAKPTFEKNIQSQKFKALQFVTCAMKGWSKNMEDAYLAEYPLLGDHDLGVFAVFDGHAGSQVAIFAKNHFVKELIKNTNFKAKNYEQALSQTFLKMDQLMQTPQGQKQLSTLQKSSLPLQLAQETPQSDRQPRKCGSTALVILLTKQKIYCANAGDSLAVANIQLQNINQIRELNIKHKPTLEYERKRIQEAGGNIINRRINGTIRVSRGLGDFYAKASAQLVLAVPEIVIIQRSCVRFLIMGCKGIWENKGSVDMISSLLSKMAQFKNNSKVLCSLFDQQVGTSQQDSGTNNMTAILITFPK